MSTPEPLTQVEKLRREIVALQAEMSELPTSHSQSNPGIVMAKRALERRWTRLRTQLREALATQDVAKLSP